MTILEDNTIFGSQQRLDSYHVNISTNEIAIFPSCLRRFLAFKFALNTEALKKYT